ncbi:MAG: TauD/TfdA family dioxygenase [Erythrobacter sp.]|jgi:taurine dioxygenase|nr:TauD/TfdA family dioxygenase [Erythrobacter sp.]
MRVAALTPFGAEAFGFDCTAADDEAANRIGYLVARHQVLVLRSQLATPPQFAAFLSRLGPLTFTEGETPVAAAPDLNLVTNIGRDRPPRSVFHTDTSYVARPPAITALAAVTLPRSGGETLFSDQVTALASLRARHRTCLAGRTVRHAYTPPSGQETAHHHPLIRVHPVTGARALYLSTPERCVALSGCDSHTSDRIIAALYRHSTRARFVYRHRWRAGDIVLWDNRTTMHRADHSAVKGDRVLHRGLVEGEAPIAAPALIPALG